MTQDSFMVKVNMYCVNRLQVKVLQMQGDVRFEMSIAPMFNYLFFFSEIFKRGTLLWQLFNIENDIEKVNQEEIQAECSRLQEVENELGGYENESCIKEKEQTKYRKEIDKQEKKLAKKKNKIDKYVSYLSIAFYPYQLLTINDILVHQQ